jgi:quinol monooxygenase YgiN
MISFTVRMRFDPTEVDEIRKHLVALAHASRLEPGCVSYIPHFLADDPNTVLIYEQYRDDAALDAHRASLHFAQHAIGGLYQGMKDRQIENLAAVA